MDSPDRRGAQCNPRDEDEHLKDSQRPVSYLHFGPLWRVGAQKVVVSPNLSWFLPQPGSLGSELCQQLRVVEWEVPEACTALPRRRVPREHLSQHWQQQVCRSG